MKKKALILSDEVFLAFDYEEGSIKPKKNFILSKLKRKVDYDNISTKNIDSLKASNYIKEFIKHYNYSCCIISLKNYDNSMKDAIKELDNSGIKTILIAAPKASKEQINNMQGLCDSSNTKYIVYDDVVKEQDANKINSVILKYCA